MYCAPGHRVSGSVIVSVRPTTADLNCAIVPLPLGLDSLETVMAPSSVASTDHPGTVPLSITVKLGLRTILSRSLQAASI